MNDNLARTMTHLKNAAKAKGKIINTTPMSDAEKLAFLKESEVRGRAEIERLKHGRQVDCPAAPSTNPTAKTTNHLQPGRIYLVDTYHHRQIIKASGQAGYDSTAKRWYLLDPASYNRIPPQCLPTRLPVQAGAGGGSPQKPAADQAPAAVSPPNETPPSPTISPDEAPPSAPVLQSPVSQPPQLTAILPWWPKETRGVPNSIVRSSLFGVVKRGKRDYLTRVRPQSMSGISLTYSGPRLDQADLDVWLGILELFKSQDIGRVPFHIKPFLSSIGRTYSSGNRAWLFRAISRLAGAVIEIDDGHGHIYGGALISEFARDKTTDNMMLSINPKLAALFQATSWSRINLTERQALGQDQLAKWLHAFYSSHAEPIPLKTTQLQELSGAGTTETREFRRELREAMSRLATTTGWSWKIDQNDYLHVHKPKPIPPSQPTNQKGGA